MGHEKEAVTAIVTFMPLPKRGETGYVELDVGPKLYAVVQVSDK